MALINIFYIDKNIIPIYNKKDFEIFSQPTISALEDS